MTSVLDRTSTDPRDAPVAAQPPSWVRRFVRGRDGDAPWVRPTLLGLLASTAVLYVWGLGASGWANAFYSAAVQAGSHSWTAMFFGSFDASNAITVDKPPASLWVMDVSARLFGVNAWSILVPQALEGVAAVGLLYATVRRRFSASAGLLAGTVLAVTPIATLMFRFNNPDSLLVLLLVGAAYATVRAVERAGTRWLVLAGVLVGFGFLTKMLQAIVVVPGFAAVYLYAAPTGLARRIRQLAVAAAAMVASAGWWVAVVTLVPAADRPYVGGSQSNSILNLMFGYNGFGRLTGQESGSVGGGGNAAGRWGATGLARMFNAEFGSQISWLLPAALVLAAGLLWLARHAPRTSAQRAQVLVWLSWLVVTALTFSLGKGIIHPYYSVALAPAIGALVGIGATALWRHRARWQARAVLATAMAATALWSTVLLGRSPTWHPELRFFVLVAGMAAALAVAGLPVLVEVTRRAAPVVAVVGLVAALAAPTAYSLETAATPHSGALPTAGPAVAGARGGPGGARPGGFAGGPAGGLGPPPGGAAGRGAMGGLLDASTPGAAVVAALRAGASSYRWVVATVGSNNAAGIQLATGLPVMAIGGFNGTDPSPTLGQFQALVAKGEIHYFAAGGGPGGGFGGPGGGNSSSTGSSITAWVESSFRTVTLGGQTFYDLTSPTASN